MTTRPETGSRLAGIVERATAGLTWRHALALLPIAYVQVLALDTVRALVLGRSLAGSMAEPLENHRELGWPVAGVAFAVATVVGALVLTGWKLAGLKTRLPHALVAGVVIFVILAALSVERTNTGTGGGARPVQNYMQRRRMRRATAPPPAPVDVDRSQVEGLLGAAVDGEHTTSTRRTRTTDFRAGKRRLSLTVRPVTAKQLARLESLNDPNRRIGRPFAMGPRAGCVVADGWQVLLATSFDLTDPLRREAADRLLVAALRTAGTDPVP